MGYAAYSSYTKKYLMSNPLPTSHITDHFPFAEFLESGHGKLFSIPPSKDREPFTLSITTNPKKAVITIETK